MASFGGDPEETVPGIGGVAEREMADALVGDAAAGEILSGEPAGGILGQEVMVVLSGEVDGAVDGVESLLLCGVAPGLGNVDADEAADLPDRLDKADAFHVLQEGVDVATRIADEALVDLLFLRNVERRVVVVVERAEADVVASALGELNVF